jgi:hypothetical protein
MSRPEYDRYDEDARKSDLEDPDIGGVKLFIGGLIAIALGMSGIYLFTNMHAVNVASNTSNPPMSTPAPEPKTPPPSTMSR